jgi:hypothetical protein
VRAPLSFAYAPTNISKVIERITNAPQINTKVVEGNTKAAQGITKVV